MSAALELGIEGIGVWSPELPNWQAARAALAENVEIAALSTTRPAPSLLPPTERRRAPEAVLIAVDVAQQACAMAGREPRDLVHVFASAYGDLAVNDYLCATLARAPLEVSPTRFHNSVHNAAAGYWAIATGCMHGSTALSAGAATFGAGLLEAALLAQRTSAPVLLSAYDVAAVGPLRDAIACRSPFAVGLVLAPPSPRACAHIRLRPRSAPAQLASESGVLHANHRDNPAAASLPLLTALARGEPASLQLAAAPCLSLDMEIMLWSK
jgi:hypothetical protein